MHTHAVEVELYLVITDTARVEPADGTVMAMSHAHPGDDEPHYHQVNRVIVGIAGGSK